MSGEPGRPGTPLRVGLLGAGAVAQVAHVPAYRRLRSARLVALCDNDPPKLRALTQRLDVPHAVRSIDDLLSIDELDAVDICLPSHLHREAVLRCLEAGKHVLCEKPLALTAEEILEIIEAQERVGKVVLVGMNHRYREDSIRLKRLTEEGVLGEPFYVRATWLKRRDGIRPDSWHFRAETSGGGVMMDLGIHLLDLALWLCDYPEPECVAASFYRHRPEIDVEDSAVATVRCRGGLRVVLDASWQPLSPEEQEYRVDLFGSEGSGRLRSSRLEPFRVFRRMHGSLVDVGPDPGRRGGNVYMESYEREIAYFTEVVNGREEAPPLEEQLALVRALAAIRRAAETGREVTLTHDAEGG